MKAVFYILFLIILYLFVLVPLSAQNPMGLYFMETIPQSQKLNPAFQPRANGFFSMPSVNVLMQSDMAFKDAFQDKGSEWVTPLSRRFDYSDLYQVIGKAANFNHYTEADLMGIGFRSGKDYFSFSVGLRNVLQTGLPADLFKITELGFPEDERFDFSSLRIKQALYYQFAFGYSRQWNDQWTFGIKVKPLFGVFGGITDIDRFQLNTSHLQWDLLVSGQIHTSGPLDVEEGQPGDFPESIEMRDLSDDEVGDYFGGFNNFGLAFDLGAEYRPDSLWTFSVALNNLGSLKFKNDLNTLAFDGAYAFDGISVEGTDDDEIEQAFEDIGDSIKTIINYDVNHDKFRIPLSPEIYLGASYQWTPAVSFGLLSRSIFQKYNFRQDFCLSANLQPYSFVSFNLNYSKRIKGGSGLGMASSILFGPLQLFLAADYMPLRYAQVSFDDEEDSFPMAYRQKDLSFLFGLNFIFGRHGTRNKQPRSE